jgi:REP element-mobilizing transposase RayT
LKAKERTMQPIPFYRFADEKTAYHLRYTWTGWPSGGEIPEIDMEAIKPQWESDGLRLLESRSSPREIQLAYSARTHVSPVLLAARAKGRLQHANRTAGLRFAGFSRKVAVRSVGDNTTADVESYIARQVAKERFVDKRFAAAMEEYTVARPEVDLRQSSETLSGRYWYNLHVVLVVAGRDRVTDGATLATLRDGCFRIATKKGHAIAHLSMLPDHLHLALRGNVSQSPQDIALGFQNNLAYILGRKPIWNDGFYVGPFSEYDFGAIRSAARKAAAR